jgi:hypothetical protein
MPSNNGFPVLSSFMTYHRVCNTKGVTSGAGTANPSGEPDFTPVFSGVGVTHMYMKTHSPGLAQAFQQKVAGFS